MSFKCFIRHESEINELLMSQVLLITEMESVSTYEEEDTSPEPT